MILILFFSSAGGSPARCRFALPFNAAFALLDLGRQPGHVEMVEGDEPALRIHAGPHRVGGADQDSDLAGVDVGVEALLGAGLLEVLHEGDLARGNAELDEPRLDPAIGGEAAGLFDGERSEIGEDHLRRAGQGVRDAVGLGVSELRRLAPDAMNIVDKGVELVRRLVVMVGENEPHVDRGVASIGDDREENIVALLRLAFAGFDEDDAFREGLLIGLEGRARLGGDDLALAGPDHGQAEIVSKIRFEDDVGDHAIHRHQVWDVHEFGKARYRLIESGGLQLELGAGLAEGGGPGVELVDAALFEVIGLHESLQGEHLAERVGDRRAGGEDEGAAGVFLGLDEARFDEEVPGALRSVRIDAFEARHVGGEGELSELLRLVHDDLIDADFADGEEIVLTTLEGVELFLEALLQALDALAGVTIIAIGLLEKLGVACDLLSNEPLLETGGRRNEFEGAVGDDDGVPGGGGGPRKEALPLIFREIGFVGDEDAGVRIELEEFAAGLREAMAGHDHHGFRDESEALLLHDCGGEAEGLAGADGVSDIGRAGGYDAPDRALLMRVEFDDAARAGKLEMAAVEVARDEVVERVIVGAREAVGALGVVEHPALEGGFDLCELFLGGFGFGWIKLALFLSVFDPDVVDLRDRGIEGVAEEEAGMAARRAPLRCGGGLIDERPHVDRPGGDFDRVADGRFNADEFGGEFHHHIGRDPGRAEAGADVGGFQVLGLNPP
jgi:hypothetical protein